jgi:hypothetical protein
MDSGSYSQESLKSESSSFDDSQQQLQIEGENNILIVLPGSSGVGSTLGNQTVSIAQARRDV